MIPYVLTGLTLTIGTKIEWGSINIQKILINIIIYLSIILVLFMGVAYIVLLIMLPSRSVSMWLLWVLCGAPLVSCGVIWISYMRYLLNNYTEDNNNIEGETFGEKD